MTNVTTPAWKSYTVGSTVEVAGVLWTITNVATRRTENGRKGRVFTLVSPDGDTVTKSSRGITLWAAGGSSPQPAPAPAPAPAAEVAADAATDAAVVSVVRERSTSESSLGQVLADVIEPYLDSRGLTSGVDRDEVIRLVDERLSEVAVRRVEVVQPNRPAVDVGSQHAKFDSLLSVLACRLNAWLVGPAGSGKTSAAKSAADALGLPFYALSVGPQTTQSQLTGYNNVSNGEYVSTQLRQAYEHGGVFLLDEVDAGSPAVLVTINALLANGRAPFADRVVERHPDFVLLAAANTIGLGADRQYVGRQQVDAATLDRFCFLDWAADPALEAAILGVPASLFAALPRPASQVFEDITDVAAVETRVQDYVRAVVRVRVATAALGKGVRFACGHRAGEHGCKLVRAGWRVEDALESCLWKGIDADTRAKIEAQ
jgi:cobaltochelatase CobS